MNFKITLASILTVLLLSSCLDCMDCQSTTDINLSIEYYSMDSGTMNLDSTNNFSFSGPGYIDGNFNLPNSITDDMSTYLSPVTVRESCGDELKRINNSTVSFQTTIGDSSALFKYNWSESWECK